MLDKYLFNGASGTAGLPAPVHIRVPSRSLFHAAENAGSKHGGTRAILKAAIQSILPAQYKDWFTKYGGGKLSIKVSGKAIAATPIPYGKDGELLRALYSALNKE